MKVYYYERRNQAMIPTPPLTLARQISSIVRDKYSLRTENMTDEINISLEETNVIRKQLGLRPIDSEPETHVERKKEPKKTPQANEGGFQFIDHGRISGLRKRLASLRNATPNSSLPSHDNENWLSEIRTGKRYKPVKIIHEDDQENELFPLRISHGIDEITSKNGAVLTLKEQSVDDEEGTSGILEDSALVQSQREYENVRLKKLSKYSNFKHSQVSSLELDRIEQSKNGVNESVVGREGELDGNDRAIADGKVKVEFDNKEGDSDNEHCTDFQPIKIKKRSKKDVRSRIKLPSRIKPVILVDEDEVSEEFQQRRIGASSKPLLKSRIHTPYEIARQIQKEKSEREDRSVNLDRLGRNSQLVIDENVQFLESFKTNIVTNSDRKEEPQGFNEVEVKTTLSVPSDNARYLEPETPDFSTGLASTLHFLQEKELLPLSNIQDDNTEINLVYRHENGAQLTRKEAYKRLSQRFHGTKSSKKKEEKFESKLRARQRNITSGHDGEFRI